MANPSHLAHELAHVKSSDFIYYSLLPPAIITVSYFLLMAATPCKWLPVIQLFLTCIHSASHPPHQNCITSFFWLWNDIVSSCADHSKLVVRMLGLAVPTALVLFVYRFLYRAQGG